MKSLIQIWQYVRPYKAKVGLNILFNFISSIFAIFSLLMLIPFLKLLFNKTERNSSFEGGISLSNPSQFKEQLEQWVNYQLSDLIKDSNELTALLMVCVAVLVIFFLKNLFSYLALYVIATIKKGVVRDLHEQLYRKMLEFPMSFFDKRKKGDLLSRFSSDVLEVEQGVNFLLGSFIKDPIMIIITLVTMFFLSAKLTLIVLITLPLSGIIIGTIGKTLKHQSRKVQEIMGHLVARMEETISGLRVIKAFTAQQYLDSQFQQENENHFRLSKKMLRKKDLSSPLSEFLGITAVVIILWLGGKMVFNGQIQAETFIAYIVIFSQVISPSKAFANAYYYVQKGMASLERIEEILHADTNIESKDQGERKEEFNHSIQFKNVNFAYDQSNVLSNVNFEILKGERIALVGASGAGKSTIVDLLLSLYPCSKGQIIVDGQEINNIQKDSWRKLIALVPQEVVLFNDTLRQNILFGNSEANKKVFEMAAKQARVDTFVNELPNSYETLIGDNGSNLSGGQRQRVALARAFVKKAPILILDEATSALDAENENYIAQAIQDVSEDKTVIIIAHRSATIDQCDKVISLENGRIKDIKVKQLLN